ncbi:MAG TPA: hypothetical protein VK202_02980 [Bacteroidia bacterium]|nr:hypothetical protein [Bacteroidia bacterium]
MKALLFTCVLCLLSTISFAQQHLPDSFVKAFQLKTTWSEKSDPKTTISMKELRTIISQKDKKDHSKIKKVIRARSGITKVYYDDRENHIYAIYLKGQLYRIYWSEWEYNNKDGASKIIKSTTWVAGNIMSIYYHQTKKNLIINLLR